MSNQNNITPKKMITTLTFIHLSFVSMLVIFAAAIYIIGEEWLFNFGSMDFGFPYFVPIAAIAGLILSDFLFKKLLKALESKNGLLGKLRGYQSAVLVKYALIEGPALLAVISAFMSGNLAYLAIGALLIFYFVLQRPTMLKVGSDLKLSGELKSQFEKQDEPI